MSDDSNRLTDAEIARIAKALLKEPRTNRDDMRKLALADGMRETAVADAIRGFKNDGDESFVEYLTRVKPETPHRYPPPEPGDGIDAALIEAACGSKPTLAARAALLAACGPALNEKSLSAWGCSERTLTPGTNPKAAHTSAADQVAKDQRRKDHSSNPFHRSGWNISAQGKLVASIGLVKANEIAASVGSRVGMTKANPDY
jgi:hypothetical protein